MGSEKKDIRSYDSKRYAWAIRAGVQGKADSYFISRRLIVLEKQGLGDLNDIEPTREAFYDAYKVIDPNKTRTAIAGIGGKSFRFAHEMQIGDLILYPQIKSRNVFVGFITNNYMYDVNDDYFPHQRNVECVRSFAKQTLSKSAQYELGAARTLFKYEKHINEIIEVVKNSDVKENS